MSLLMPETLFLDPVAERFDAWVSEFLVASAIELAERTPAGEEDACSFDLPGPHLPAQVSGGSLSCQRPTGSWPRPVSMMRRNLTSWLDPQQRSSDEDCTDSTPEGA